MTIWIDAEAFVEALNRSSVFGWSTEQDETAHKWVFHEIEKFLNDNQPNTDSDTISRQAAILAITGEPPEAHYPSWYAERIKSLPSAEQVTGKLNNPDDSLLTADSEACKEQKSKLDLISRQDAIAYFFRPYSNEELYSNIDIEKALNALPSAPDSRQRGEWVRLEREENVYDLHGVQTWGVNYMCDKCGFITTAIQDHFAQYKWCPSCGARMYKGGEDE